MLHAFFLSALNGEKGVNWASDAGSVWDKALGIMWSNDWEDKSKTPHIPWEFKTHVSQRRWTLIRTLTSTEQLLIYMVAQGSTTGRLVVLQPNLPAPRGKVGSYPSIERTLYRSRLRISNCSKSKYPNSKGVGDSLKTKKPKEPPLCREFKARSGELPALSTVQNPKGDTEKKELGPDMISTIGSKHAQSHLARRRGRQPEKAILVTDYECGGLIEIKQGESEIDVNYESIPLNSSRP